VKKTSWLLLLAAALLAAAPTPARAAPGPLSEVIVDVLEEGAPIRDVLRRLEERHGLNWLAADDALDRAGLVTVRLRKVPLDVALDAICAACGLAIEPRGSILIIRSRPDGAPPPLPRVQEGLAPRDDGRPRLPAPDAPVGGDRIELEDLQASGRLVELDLEGKRVQLSIEGTRVDFVVRAIPGQQLQVTRLGSALHTLRKGSRVALLYRRDGDDNVITGIVGRTDPHYGRRPERVTTPPPAGMPRGEGDVAAPSSLTPTPLARTGEEAGEPEEELPLQPAPRPLTPKPRPQVLVPDGALAGTFVARAGEVVQVRLATAQVVELRLPPEVAADADAATTAMAERRAKVLAAIDLLRAEDKIALTYEELPDGTRVITNTITQSR